MTSVSIVITNHNYERFVTNAVESALGQTVTCQVVVVDDGSSDGSLARLQELTDRIDLVTKPNGGQASAFNAGWKAARGEVVMFLDGDDVLAADAAQRVATALAADPGAVRCQFRLQWIDGDGNRIPGSFPEPDRRLPAGDLVDRVLSNPDDIAWQPTSGNAFTSRVLSSLLPMPEEPYRISADHYLSNLSALYGSVVAIESDLGFYRVHGANADHRAVVDMDRLRDIMVRTVQTRRLVIEHGRSLGLAVPPDVNRFRSLTHSAARLASWRVDRVSSGRHGTTGHRHPFAGDHYRQLVVDGMRAAAARRDLGPAGRVKAMAWIATLAVAPRTLVPRALGMGLTR